MRFEQQMLVTDALALRARRSALLPVVASIALLAASLALATPVRAATITVNTTNDELNADGDCSLREAIEAANTDAAVDACAAGTGADDVVSIPADTYLLALDLGQLVVSETVTISGAEPGAAIDGQADDRVFNLAGGFVTLSNLTITNGQGAPLEDPPTVFVPQPGAGIFVGSDATLYLVDSAVTDNHVLGDDADGGGIFLAANAAAEITNSEISTNSAGGDGGGIMVTGGASLTVTDTVVAGNAAVFQGGGIALSAGQGLVVDSIVAENSASAGGGIANDFGDLALVGSWLLGNTADLGGGAYSTGVLDVLDSTIEGNAARTGGGIAIPEYILFDVAPLTTIEGSTFTGNNAVESKGGGFGGGIYSGSDLFVVNSTFSGNDATQNGGGLHVFGVTAIDFSTIADNSSAFGGGIALDSQIDGSLTLFATIVADNAGGDCLVDDASASLGSNLDSDDTCNLDQLGDQSGVDPMLGPLADNGGPTSTHALLAGSPAIDAVLAGELTPCVGVDQRTTVRPQDGDDDGALACDIGAFEVLGAVGGGSPSPGSPSPGASTLPDTASRDGSSPRTPWLGFALLTALAAAALPLTRLRAGRSSR